ncbi:acetyltransferase [Enterococcus avium]|uniref:GNAT family N-acetyltransferase n=1 Tax=Enterococcus malodoratus TaxID=71451 RepID=UPI0008B8320B|nr:GNAT family N-acetyltransferase [Enterococcus malodoratus]BBM19206.1 acetyltransferase [Enterococcus avium]SES85982.1 ElaA protein [Enterococcus malodoratus]
MIKSTDELTSQELLTILQIRTAVFVVEQNCPYQEVDEADRQALHVCLEEDGKIKAYARILATDDPIHFGRVLVVKEYRGQQLGRKIVEKTLKEIEKRYPNRVVVISAQAHLAEFYGSFGFKPNSEIYLEDDIPHIEMLLQKNENQ